MLLGLAMKRRQVQVLLKYYHHQLPLQLMYLVQHHHNPLPENQSRTLQVIIVQGLMNVDKRHIGVF